MVIGEAVKNIPEDILKTESEIEWRKIAGFCESIAQEIIN
jgi:uncharacterized protein with HEPN domain